MSEHIDLEEDEEWTAALTADGWSKMDHTPHSWEIDAHIRSAFGQAQVVLHEQLSKYVHLNIHVIGPSDGRAFTTYVTSGMSDLPMNAPDELSEWRRAELVIALPGPPEAHVDAAGRRHYLIDQMRNYARRPHALGTYFILGDTIDPFDPDESIGPDTQLAAHLLGRPMITPIIDGMDAFRATLSTGETVNFLALEPIHADELDLKVKQGSEELIERLEAAGVTELYEPSRPSVADEKGRGFSLKRLLGG